MFFVYFDKVFSGAQLPGRSLRGTVSVVFEVYGAIRAHFSTFFIGAAMYGGAVTYEKCDHQILAPQRFPHIKNTVLQ